MSTLERPQLYSSTNSTNSVFTSGFVCNSLMTTVGPAACSVPVRAYRGTPQNHKIAIVTTDDGNLSEVLTLGPLPFCTVDLMVGCLTCAPDPPGQQTPSASAFA